MASYILDNHLGIAISKLSEIEEKIALLTSQDIDFMNRCIEKESFALRNGYMLANALQCAIEN